MHLKTVCDVQGTDRLLLKKHSRSVLDDGDNSHVCVSSVKDTVSLTLHKSMGETARSILAKA